MRRTTLLGILFLALWSWCTSNDPAQPESIRLGTFNIRFFPEPTTDRDAVAARIAEMDADIFAVQEIVDRNALLDVLRAASEATGRNYEATFARYCGSKRTWYLGVVYDASRVRLLAERPLTDRRRCQAGGPNAHVALLEKHGERLALVSMHLKAGGAAENHEWRRRQWIRALGVQRRLEDELGGVPVVLAGDFNTTGFRDDGGGERSFIDFVSRASGVGVVTRGVPCTAYWRAPSAEGGYAPSTLDHVVARGGRWGRARVLGQCRAHACELVPPGEKPRDFDTVSDHCAVVVERQL